MRKEALPLRLRSRAHRLGALALGVLLIAAQVSPALHLLVVSHVRCAEHGDLIDAPGPDARHADEATPSQAHLVEAERGAGHDHDHCPLVRAGGAISISSSLGAARTFAPASPERTLADLVATPHVPLLRLAPKNSPPV